MGHKVCGFALMALIATLPAVNAFAQAPWKLQRPIELIVVSAAGNSNDLMLRLIAQTAQENRLLDVPMNVMNKLGASALPQDALQRMHVQVHFGEQLLELGVLALQHLQPLGV